MVEWWWPEVVCRLLALLVFGVTLVAAGWALGWGLLDHPGPPHRYCLADTSGFNPHAIKGLPICRP